MAIVDWTLSRLFRDVKGEGGKQVLGLMLSGFSRKDIANMRGVNVDAVRERSHDIRKRYSFPQGQVRNLLRQGLDDGLVINMSSAQYDLCKTLANREREFLGKFCEGKKGIIRLLRR